MYRKLLPTEDLSDCARKSYLWNWNTSFSLTNSCLSKKGCGQSYYVSMVLWKLTYHLWQRQRFREPVVGQIASSLIGQWAPCSRWCWKSGRDQTGDGWWRTGPTSCGSRGRPHHEQKPSEELQCRKRSLAKSCVKGQRVKGSKRQSVKNRSGH